MAQRGRLQVTTLKEAFLNWTAVNVAFSQFSMLAAYAYYFERDRYHFVGNHAHAAIPVDEVTPYPRPWLHIKYTIMYCRGGRNLKDRTDHAIWMGHCFATDLKAENCSRLQGHVNQNLFQPCQRFKPTPRQRALFEEHMARVRHLCPADRATFESRVCGMAAALSGRQWTEPMCRGAGAARGARAPVEFTLPAA